MNESDGQSSGKADRVETLVDGKVVLGSSHIAGSRTMTRRIDR